ncbi:MAG TPA: type II CRISPR RNA-guided endonuclease Cas9 [Magnetospirillum sp.]|nr:type II CRISPR RNA-guided endonuclease Cas9 [Magnetospirillum sp.]
MDLGAGSLGWFALKLNEEGDAIGLIDGGVRIFGDGRAATRGGIQGTPLAVERRAARAMRRRRDRFKQRQTALIQHLTKAGLFPADREQQALLEALDPYELRARALDFPLPPHSLGRAFFHLNQRRGFKSNRKTDRATEDDSGKIAIGIDRLRAAMAELGARTFGEFLHMRRISSSDPNAVLSVRARLRPETTEGSKGDGYDFYPGRDLIAEEFDAIWDAQAAHHPDLLTADTHDRLYEIVFHQRPLKAARIGGCTLVAGETRLPKAHPLFQRRRLLEEVNALRLVRAGQAAEPLTMQQRDLLLLKLKAKKKVSFASLRKVLKLDPETRFNKESDHRPDLAGDEVAAELSDKKRFGNRWFHLTADQQSAIVERLREDEDENALCTWLETEHNLSAEQARATAKSRLPDGYGRFGLTATQRLIEALQAEVIVYSEAVARAGLGHHSDLRTGEIHAELPYYGVAIERHILPGTADPNDQDETRIGRLTNPTVHIGLNQLRRVVNRLIARFGLPAEVAIEIGRDLKLSEDEKIRRNRDNNKNRIEAARRSAKLLELGKPDTGGNRALLKLWEELNPDNILDRRCVYSGEQISVDMLFSSAVEIDHILPFSSTLDDSNANKILCLREANRQKRKRSPFEAWGHTPQWPEIAGRAARLPREKRWRFEPDAMQRLEEKGGFIARHLVDTQYLSRLAHEYLSALFPDKGEGSSHVWVSPGRLTEMVRRKLGLNELLPDHNVGGGAEQPKNRLDHRHHAIDAAVVAIIDRSLLQAVSRASAREGDEGRERIIIPEPWPGFRDELRDILDRMVVSHRPDHGTASKAGLPRGRDQTAGKLHNDTAYGLTGEKDERGNDLVVHRAPLAALKKAADLEKIRDRDLAKALAQAVHGLEGKDFECAVAAFASAGPPVYRGIRRVRLIEPLTVIPIKDRQGKAYKGYKGDSNYRDDVWELPDGKWEAEVVSMYDAHQADHVSALRTRFPTARKVLRLYRNDLVALTTETGRKLMRVLQIWQNGQITLVEPQEAGDFRRRSKSEDDPFAYTSPTASGLQRLCARQIRMDELGRVLDPGFPARKARRKTRRNPALTG